MAAETREPIDPTVIDKVPIDQAFLSIPDEDNEPIIDLKMTFWVTVISAAAFIGVVFLFVF